MLTTYTWSANWDNLWGAGSQVYSTYGPQDAFNPKAERSARSEQRAEPLHRSVQSTICPFGRGKMFLGKSPWYLDELVGGWQINDEWTMQNGVPLSVIQTNLNTGLGTTGFGGSYQRPNLVGDAHCSLPLRPSPGTPGCHLLRNRTAGLREHRSVQPCRALHLWQRTA